MAKHLVAQLLADIEAGRSSSEDARRVFVNAACALWSEFFSVRRTRQLSNCVQTLLSERQMAGVNQSLLYAHLTLLLEMAARRDGRLGGLISADHDVDGLRAALSGGQPPLSGADRARS